MDCKHELITCSQTLYNDPEGELMIRVEYSCKECKERLKIVDRYLD